MTTPTVRTALLITLMLVVAGCDRGGPPRVEPAPVAAAPAPGATAAPAPLATPAQRPSEVPHAVGKPSADAATCPATDFPAFLAQFESDVATQKAFVTDPLVSSSIDPNAEPEPAPVVKQLNAAEVTFPIIPDPQKQAHDGLKQTITKISATEYTVALVKPDTDYQMSFHFRNDGCWHLYRVEDESL